MKVSVIIPSLYEADGAYLKEAVESLRATCPDWDIIVITNGTTNKPDLTHIKGITVHAHVTAQGQCGAVNAASQLVNEATDYLMVSNSDMYYPPSWNKNLRFDHLVFSPNLVEPTNNKGSAPPFMKLDGGFVLEDFSRMVVDDFIKSMTRSFPYKKREEAGFNLPFFIRKDVWNTVGGYDVIYDPWGSNSDTDLQTKIELAGIKPMRLRDVLVYHFSNKAGTFEGHQDFWQHNWDYYTEKWGFNRDDTNGDPWYCKNMIDLSKLKYSPPWKDKYAKKP